MLIDFYRTWSPKLKSPDTDALADYVLALVKSGGPEGYVRKSCISNLSTFLRNRKKFSPLIAKALRILTAIQTRPCSLTRCLILFEIRSFSRKMSMQIYHM